MQDPGLFPVQGHFQTALLLRFLPLPAPAFQYGRGPSALGTAQADDGCRELLFLILFFHILYAVVLRRKLLFSVFGNRAFPFFLHRSALQISSCPVFRQQQKGDDTYHHD